MVSPSEPSPRESTRRSPRAKVMLPVSEKRQAWPPGVTRDISFEGMFIATERPLDVGERFVVNVGLPDCEVPLEVAAEVVHSHRLGEGVLGKGMGVRLLHSGEAQRAFFVSQVRRLMEAKG